MTITDRDVRTQITTVLDAGEGGSGAFDVDAITAEIIGRFGLVDIDTIGNTEFWGVVAAHDRSAAARPGPVTAADLAAIPAEHRRTIALWLTQRASALGPSVFLSAHASESIQRAMTGAAVDIADPLSEDTTIGHAAQVLGEIGAFGDRPTPA